MARFGWRPARGRGGDSYTLLRAVRCLAIGHRLLGKTASPVFDARARKLSDFTAPVLAEVRAAACRVRALGRDLGTVFTIYRENLELQAARTPSCAMADVALVARDTACARYEQLLNAVPEPSCSSVTARVIGESSRPFVKTMILNAGSAIMASRKGQAVARRARPDRPHLSLSAITPPGSSCSPISTAACR